MFDIGFSEMVMFGAIALIVLGPEKLPQAARTAGKWYAKTRRTLANLQHDIEHELNLTETRKEMQEELAKIRETKVRMQQEMAEFRGNIQRFEQEHHSNLASSTSTTTINSSRQHQTTMPMTGSWFPLGDYDKKRRLPPAPLQANYQADPLLNAMPISRQSFPNDVATHTEQPQAVFDSINSINTNASDNTQGAS